MMTMIRIPSRRCASYYQLLLSVLVVLLCTTPVAAVRKLQIAVPLQALTIWDPEFKEQIEEEGGAASRRDHFLPRFRAGLQAEAAERQRLLEEQQQQANRAVETDASSNSKNWAAQAKALDLQRARANEARVERAHDEALALYDSQLKKKASKRNANQYQFVGVVNSVTDNSNKPPITWYTRKKPAHAKWSIRLVHVNREAVLKDLYNRRKIDIFGRYENTGQRDPKTGQAIVTAHYAVRKRSWKNLWNFNLKHMFTDSSGMYWRERRLPPGLYTDGSTVYEASYRYRDGRNGMHRVSSFDDFLKSRSIPKSRKEKIVQRLAKDAPDVVLED